MNFVSISATNQPHEFSTSKISHYFHLRNYVNADNESPIYLVLRSRGERSRININVSVSPDHWDHKKKRIKDIADNSTDLNLILDNISANITEIKTLYRLQKKELTLEKLREELFESDHKINFLNFVKKQLSFDEKTMKKGTFKRYKSVCKKLEGFRNPIYFKDITHEFISDYKLYCYNLGNLSTTIAANIKAIKKWLRLAKRQGISIPIDIDTVESGKTSGTRVSLSISELKKVKEYYESDCILPAHRMTLGYFLFSCFTGLRISDLMNLRRKDLTEDIEFVSVKSNKENTISLNQTAKDLIKNNTQLFVDFLNPVYMNRVLKDIASILDINKHLTFHVSRHTFATNFLRMGGQVEKLQVLMGHSKIETTMVYVHILAAEANKEIHLLDNVFK